MFLPLIHELEVALAIGAGCIAIYGLQLCLRQRSLVFQPTRSMLGTPADFGQIYEEIALPLAKDVSINVWWIPADPGSKVILYFPGSIGNVSSDLSTFAYLGRMGTHILAIDYPGFGRSTGNPGEAICYQAAELVYRYAIEQRGVSATDVIVFGRSLGAAVAAWLAARHPCRALIMHSGFCSIPAVAADRYPFLPVSLFCFYRFNTLRYLRLCECPTLIMHSSKDKVILPKHGDRLFASALGPKFFVPLRGDHLTSEWLTTPQLAPVLSSLLTHGVPA